MQVIKNFRWCGPESRAYYIMIQKQIQAPIVLAADQRQIPLLSDQYWRI